MYDTDIDGPSVSASEALEDRREAPHGLTNREARFAAEYLVDLNGTQAMLRAAPDLTRESAAVQAHRLLRRAKVASRIQELFADRAARLQISSDEVLARLWAIATADARELVSLYVIPCPSCWPDPPGMSKDTDQAETTRVQGSLIPNQSCGECIGIGVPKVVYADTRHLSPAAAGLYAGVRQHRHSIEVLLQDRLAAFEMIGRHLGMWGPARREPNMAEYGVTKLLAELAEVHGGAAVQSEDSAAPAAPQRPPVQIGKWRAVSTPRSNPLRGVKS